MPVWRKAWPVAAVLCVAVLVTIYVRALLAPAVGVFHDDGVYLVTARSLATGGGYRIASLPQAVPETKYPILFPALLAGVWRLVPDFPANLPWLKAVSFGGAIAWLVLSARLLGRQCADARAGCALALLAASSPWVLFLSTAVLSETVFASLATGALLAVDTAAEKRPFWLALPAILASGAFLTRTIGVAVIAACAITLLLRAGRTRAALFMLICAALCTPWLAWHFVQRASISGVDVYYSLQNYETWNIVAAFPWNQKNLIFGTNLLGILVGPAILMGFPSSGWGAVLAPALGFLAVLGIAQRLRARWSALEWFVAIYLGIVLLWAWPPTRFLAPLLPALLYYAYLGTLACCRWAGWNGRTAGIVVASLAILLAAQSSLALARGMAEATTQGHVGVPNCDQDDWAETQRLLDWVRLHTPPHAVLMANIDPLVYLYTDRHSLRGFLQNPFLLHYSQDPQAWPLGDPATGMATIERRGVDYLVCTPDLFFKEGPWLHHLHAELLAQHAGTFTLVYEGRDPRFRIYSVRQPALVRWLPPVSK